MGTREKDLNPNIYIGLQLPLNYQDPYSNPALDPNDPNRSSNVAQKGTEGFFPQTKTLREQVSHNLRMLLQTIPGERVMNSEFGSRLHELLFEPMSEGYKDIIEEEIRSVVARFLPYVIIDDIQILFSNTNSNKVSVSLTISLTTDATPQTVEADFTQWSDYVPTEVGVNIEGGEPLTEN